MDMLLKKIIQNYQLAIQEKSAFSHHLSFHWKYFHDQFTLSNNPDDWATFRKKGFSKGLDCTIGQKFTKQDSLKILYDIIKKELGRFSYLIEESPIGCPDASQIDGQLVSESSCNFAYYAFRLLTETHIPIEKPIKILEIGSGYGGLARTLKQLFPNAIIYLFDLPHALALASYYINKNFPNLNAFYFSNFLENGGIIPPSYDAYFLPGWAIEKMPDASIDLVINTCSMMEMTGDIIRYYFDHIHRIINKNGFFYCVNRYTKQIGQEPICIGDYPFDSQWKLRFSAPKWDAPHIHELLLQRESSIKDPNFQPTIQQLNKIGKLITALRNKAIKVLKIKDSSDGIIIPTKAIIFGCIHDVILIFNQTTNKIYVKKIKIIKMNDKMAIIESKFRLEELIVLWEEISV